MPFIAIDHLYSMFQQVSVKDQLAIIAALEEKEVKQFTEQRDTVTGLPAVVWTITACHITVVAALRKKLQENHLDFSLMHIFWGMREKEPRRQWLVDCLTSENIVSFMTQKYLDCSALQWILENCDDGLIEALLTKIPAQQEEKHDSSAKPFDSIAHLTDAMGCSLLYRLFRTKRPKKIIEICFGQMNAEVRDNELNRQEKGGWSVFNICLRFQEAEVCQFVIEQTSSKALSHGLRLRDNQQKWSPLTNCLRNQTSAICQLLINKVSVGSLIDTELDEADNGWTSLSVCFRYQDSMASQALMSKYDALTLNATLMHKHPDDWTTWKVCVRNQDDETIQAMIDKTGAETLNKALVAKDKAGWCSFETAVSRCNFLTLTRMLNRCSAFSLLKVDVTRVKSYLGDNNNLTTDNKNFIQKHVDDCCQFLQNPELAMRDQPKKFIVFAAQEFNKMAQMLFAKEWVDVLQKALVVCDKDDNEKFDKLNALLGRAALSHYHYTKASDFHYFRVAYQAFFKLSETKYLDVQDNQFIGIAFTDIAGGSRCYSSKDEEKKPAIIMPTTDVARILAEASSCYSVFKNGLSHLLHAAEQGKDENVKALLLSYAGIDEQKIEFSKLKEAVLHKMAELNQEKIQMLEQLEWKDLSRQFRAEVLQKEAIDEPFIISLAKLKLNFEIVEFENKALVLAEIRDGLITEKQRVKASNQYAAPSLFKSHPYLTWLEATLGEVVKYDKRLSRMVAEREKNKIVNYNYPTLGNLL